MKNLCVCFTGHRVIPAHKAPVVASRLYDTLKELVREGFCEFAAGGALGFDTLAAKVVLALKKEFPIIKLRLILPCPDQTKGWKSADVAVYEEIKSQASIQTGVCTCVTADLLKKALLACAISQMSAAARHTR